MDLNRLELRELAERLFTIAHGFSPNAVIVEADEKRLRAIEEEIIEAFKR